MVITENSFIEIGETIVLSLCLIPCWLYATRSRLAMGRRFWLGCIFILLIIIRRELSFLSDILVPANFSYLGHDYDWWEDVVLISLALLGLGYILVSWRYWVAILKRVPRFMYVTVVTLIVLQYLGEHTLLFGHDWGVFIEEVSEGLIYSLALLYLVKFKLCYFEKRLVHRLR